MRLTTGTTKYVVIVIVVLALSTLACSVPGLNGLSLNGLGINEPQVAQLDQANAPVPAEPARPTPTTPAAVADPEGEADQAGGAEAEEPAAVFNPLVGSGRVIWNDQSDGPWTRTLNGMYNIPLEEIRAQAPGSVVIFEGEYHNAIGVHQICFIAEEASCPVDDGHMVINQGTLWAFDPNVGQPLNDVLMAFAHDKWDNGRVQGIEYDIAVNFDNALQAYPGGMEPVLTAEQRDLVERNAGYRCPEREPRLEESPFANAETMLSMTLSGSFGSYACSSVFIGKVDPIGQTVALYWDGAMDNFEFVPAGAEFYFVPNDWDEEDIAAWVAEEHDGLVLAEYTPAD